MRQFGRSLLPLLLAALVLAPGTSAQQATPQARGIIVGKIVDAETGQPLSGAQIQVVGTNRGSLSGVDGRYTIAGTPAGTHSIRVMLLGHGEKVVEGVRVPAGGSVAQDITMTSTAIALAGITVSASVERGTVTAALSEQRTAVGVVSATTLDQIAKSPDSDASQAIRRVSGVTVQDGKYVFVRGLGERYTTTSLNGARVPSPDPEKKVVPLDLFPSSLLEAITTSKTFTPDQPGDFSGAQVDLRTRSFPANRVAQVSLSGGYNPDATGQELLGPRTTGREWLAMAAGSRQLPSRLTAITDFSRLTQSDINGLIRSMPGGWSPADITGAPNASGGLSFGGEDAILGQRLGYIGSLTYSRTQSVKLDELKSRAVPGDAAGTPEPFNPFLGSTSQSTVLWGGLLNLSTYLGENAKIEINNTYNRTADNSAHLDWGTLEEFQQVDSVRRTSVGYVERVMRSNQIVGEHELGTRHKVRWSATSSGVSRTEPDRADLAYGYEFAPSGQRLPLAWLGFIPEAAKRTSGELTEDALSGTLDYTLTAGAEAEPFTLRVGGAYRDVSRDALSLSYNLRALGLSAADRVGTPEQLFDGAYTQGSAQRLTLEPNNAGGRYSANDRVSAGYGLAEIPVGSRLRIIGGARFERWRLDMDAQPVASGDVKILRTNNDVLPSLALNLKLTDRQSLRLSASQTLSRPEYRELAPISYRDMLGDREVFGDSSLVRTLVQNYDARWEWYPNVNEVLSVAFFAKNFDGPIEQIDVATSGVSQLSFINGRSASNYGVELEARKRLGFMGAALDPFELFSNVTVMRSRINTGNSTLSALTNDKRPMVGQAPYVVNAGLTYASPSGATNATLFYNVVGRRITSAAVAPISVDTYEQPRNQIDLSLRFPLYGGLTGKLDARNLLDATYEERQGDVVRYRYRSGRSFTFGMTWKLQ
jgi:hypothetical protein